MTKSTKWHVRPAKTQISLGIRPVWSESSLSAWRHHRSLAIHWTHSEDSDQTGRIPRLIWFLAGPTYHFVGCNVCHAAVHLYSHASDYRLSAFNKHSGYDNNILLFIIWISIRSEGLEFADDFQIYLFKEVKFFYFYIFLYTCIWFVKQFLPICSLSQLFFNVAMNFGYFIV